MNSLWHKASGLKEVMVLRGAALMRRGRDRVLSRLIAAKDRQFADLRENWLKTHEAFRLSQEALARKDIELTQRDAQIAQKDAQLAELRNNWIEAYEALEYRRKLLAEKDAQLAQSQAESDAVAKAFRLCQEMLAQKEV